ncbi:MAG: DUF2934 domain-containing protein [Parvibaculaceae bacterium]
MTRLSPVTEERIRERAYRLWIEEGRPDGKASEHWEKARELLELEADPEEGREEPDEGYNDPGPWGEPVEQASVLENLGEFPTMTDQGEQEIPRRRKPAATKRRPSVSRKRPM